MCFGWSGEEEEEEWDSTRVQPALFFFFFLGINSFLTLFILGPSSNFSNFVFWSHNFHLLISVIVISLITIFLINNEGFLPTWVNVIGHVIIHNHVHQRL